jgi:hypothetical protein
VLLGDQRAACRGNRARQCPVPGHPCLNQVTAADVVAAVTALLDEEVAGTVEEIQGATAAMFSLFPEPQQLRNFEKVTQVIPVKIALTTAESL